MYFVRVDFSYDHNGETRTRDILDNDIEVVRALERLVKNPHITILQVRVELCQ